MIEVRDITDAIKDLKEALDRFHGEKVLVLVFEGSEGTRRFEVKEGDR